MKEIYLTLQQTLNSSSAIELAELKKAKGLSADLFAMFAKPLAAAGKPSENEKRIRIFIADIKDGSKEAAAARVLRTAIPDVKIYSAGRSVDFSVFAHTSANNVSADASSSHPALASCVSADPSSSHPALASCVSADPNSSVTVSAACKSCIPDICDGILQTDQESALFAVKNMEKFEQITIGKEAGAILSAALSLAAKADYKDKSILVYLPDR